MLSGFNMPKRYLPFGKIEVSWAISKGPLVGYANWKQGGNVTEIEDRRGVTLPGDRV
jgi:hypothetical protein